MTDTLANQLTALKFRGSSDASLRAAAAAGDATEFQKKLKKSLAVARRRFQEIFADTAFVSSWSAVVADSGDEHLKELLTDITRETPTLKSRALARKLQPVIEHLAEVCGSIDMPPSAFAAIAAAELILRYIEHLTADQTATIVIGLAQRNVEDHAGDLLPETPVAADSLALMVAMGEVPFVLGLLLEPLKTARAWRRSGSAALARAVEEATDTDGTLQAAMARNVDRFLAPLVRVGGWAKAFRTDWGSRKPLRRWNQIVERTAALVIPDGLIMIPQPRDCEVSPASNDCLMQILDGAVRLSNVSSTSAEAALVKSLSAGGRKRGKRGKRARSSAGSGKAVRCSVESDWASVALLRSGLQVDTDVVAMDWDEAEPHLHLAALGTRILGGRWHNRILINGLEQPPIGDWVCTCWFEDKEVAFAELESGSADGLRHVRHVMLSLQDHFAVVTDSVTSPHEDVEVEFVAEIPLAAGVTAESNTITRELLLLSDCVSVRAVPTWLEDDRIQNCNGSCETKDGRLVLKAAGAGGATLPLVLDWHPERMEGDADWNRLTVCEMRQVQGPQTAAGFRVRIGRLQLMLYRSLRRGETLRSVLGHHTGHETVYGRVKKAGDIAPLVMVESDA